jgi:NOL1/NOP2/fmu family ribosome biogenesis protein
MKLLRRLLRELNSGYSPEDSRIIRINDQYFILDAKLCEPPARKDLVYAGLYLGRDRRVFEPSAILLETLSKEKETRKVNVDRETAWLFVCGRDIFQENILHVEGELGLGSYCLVLYDGRCLGYGRYETVYDARMVRNYFNVGDFLHRENSAS